MSKYLRKRRRSSTIVSTSSESENGEGLPQHSQTVLELVELDPVSLSLARQWDLEENYGVIVSIEKIPYGLENYPDVQHRLISHDEKTGVSQLSVQKFILKHRIDVWNRYPDQVYACFDVRKYIVDSQHFLAVSHTQHIMKHTMDNILQSLENNEESHPSWSNIRDNIETFLSVYEGYEDLPNLMEARNVVSALVDDFRRMVTEKKRNSEGKMKRLYKFMMHFANELAASCLHKPDGVDQYPDANTSVTYVNHLMNIFVQLARVPLYVHNDALKLYIPVQEGKKVEMTKINVKPDFFVAYEKIIFVGQAQEYAWDGPLVRRYEANHSTLNDEPTQGTGESDPSSSSEKKDQEGNADDNMTNSTAQNLIWRNLSKEEEYKVRCHLPQLMGQMLTAMQRNKSKLTIGQDNENVQLGFAVEGFKLRLVKLVLRDDTSRMSQGPSVDAFLAGVPLKCDVFLTEEFNLFSKKHITMLFQMILAISYVATF